MWMVKFDALHILDLQYMILNTSWFPIIEQPSVILILIITALVLLHITFFVGDYSAVLDM